MATLVPEDVLSAVGRSVPEPFTPEEAIALFIINGKQTKAQYQNMRSAALWKKVDIYPTYHEILKAKKESYPILNPEYFSEMEAKVSLQHLVDRTAERILKNIPIENCPNKLNITFKWGMDGSSGHPEFKQRFINPENSDATVMCTHALPLFIEGDKILVWNNESPNSSSLCRPIRMAFCKEDQNSIMAEYTRMLKEIDNLRPSKIKMSETYEVEMTHTFFTFYFFFLFTMINGKVMTPNALKDF
nr:uncharacterized protein LOC111420083 [Onthophagus taurus]